MAKARKNNDNISYSGFQWDFNLLRGIEEASRRHEKNRQDVALVREYLDRHPEQLIRLRTRQIPITGKSAGKILIGIIKRAKLEAGQRG